MSASDPNSSIFMTDSANQIKNKINRAFSGGKETVEEHRRLGGDPDVDVAYQYLSFFIEDDEELAQMAEDYRSGKLLTSELKAKCIKMLQGLVGEFQARKAKVTDDDVRNFMDPNRSIDYQVKKY